MGAKVRNGDADALIARVAARQHGVVTLDQLESAGIRRRGREIRLKRGHLHRIHRSVFAVGHRGLSREGHWMAAVLALGDDAVLSHTSAAVLWGMIRSRGRSPHSVRFPIHVTVLGSSENRPGIRVHRSRTLSPDQTTRHLGIPVTTPSRTLLDLRRTVPKPQFAAALREAEYLGLPVGEAPEPDHTRSELESRFLALCRRHRIPQPLVNTQVGPSTVDFLWTERRLIVEVDGYRAHGGRAAFETDRARDLELRLLGYDVLRFTWRQVTQRPREVMTALRHLMP